MLHTQIEAMRRVPALSTFATGLRNWGECKGEDGHIDICVVMNKTILNSFTKNKLGELAVQTKNKLYVACSRARGNLYFVPENFFEKYKK